VSVMLKVKQMLAMEIVEERECLMGKKDVFEL
jgi:hypothetical protein